MHAFFNGFLGGGSLGCCEDADEESSEHESQPQCTGCFALIFKKFRVQWDM